MITKIIIGLLVLSFIVVIHELGHFLFAKRAGIYVEEFCVGLGPRVLHKKWGETIYAIRLFPIGGACIMKGEDSASDDEEYDTFGAKTVWQRISVVLAGPFFNFILAFVVALILIMSTGVNKPIVGDVIKGDKAELAGIKKGDEITKVGSTRILTSNDLILELYSNKGKSLDIEIKRGEDKKVVNIDLGQDDRIPKIGVMMNIEKEKLPFFQNFRYAAHEVKYWVKSVFVSLKQIFSGNVTRKDISGPLGIVNMIGSSVTQNVNNGISAMMSSLAFFVILISANLGVMNLLPFPALDGGRFLFLVYELVTGKKPNSKIEGYVNLAGFVALMGLMVFLFYNDIINLIQR